MADIFEPQLGSSVGGGGGGGGGSPSGAAGGDLAGNYPNPILKTVATPGTYGDATHVPQMTIDAKGRVTGVTEVSVSGIPNGGGTGQVLTKVDNTDYNVSWQNIPAPPAPTGTANRFTQFDGSGTLAALDKYLVSGVGTINFQYDATPGDDGLEQLEIYVLSIAPTEDSPTKVYQPNVSLYYFDANNDGFDFGTGGQAILHESISFSHANSADIGGIAIRQVAINYGGGGPIQVGGLSIDSVGGGYAADVTLNGPIQGWNFNVNFDAGSFTTSLVYANIFGDFSNMGATFNGSWNSFVASPNIAAISTNHSYVGYSAQGHFTELQGNANYYGFQCSPTIDAQGTQGSVYGYLFNPAPSTVNSAYGIWVSTSNITVYAGVKASLTIQDLFIEMNVPNAGDNSLTVEYVNDTTAGNESVVLSYPALTVHIESGVSTADQVRAAFLAHPQFASSATVTVTGVGSNPQVTQAPTNLTGGENPGQKLAAYFQGDVQIDGNFNFTGDLNAGAINAFKAKTLVSGTFGVPQSAHGFISQWNIPASATLTNADMIGINTAALINVGAGATVSTSLLGVAALGLPAVVTMGAGSVVDDVVGAVFALSLDNASGASTITQLELCKAMMIPNGTTTIDYIKGFSFDLPFGSGLGTNIFGLYTKPSYAHNFMAGDLKVGGTPGSSDIAETGYGVHIHSGKLLGVGDVTTAQSFTAAENYLLFPRLTETERDALTAAEGMVVYNSTSKAINFYDGTAWQAGGGGGGISSVGTFDSQTPSADGLVILGADIYAQSASATDPGMVNTAAQSFSGEKTFLNEVVVGSIQTFSTPRSLQVWAPATHWAVLLGSEDPSYGGIVWTPTVDGFQFDSNNHNFSAPGKLFVNPSGGDLYFGLAQLKFPNADGTSGQVLTTDGSAGLSWSTPAPHKVKHLTVAASYFASANSGSPSTSQSVDLLVGGVVPAGSVISGVQVVVSTAFSGGSVASGSMDVTHPDAGTLTTSIDVMTASFAQNAFGNWYAPTSSPLSLVLTVTGGNVADLTSGLLDVWVAYIPLPTSVDQAYS